MGEAVPDGSERAGGFAPCAVPGWLRTEIKDWKLGSGHEGTGIGKENLREV
jgi:hypothetical protein